MRRTSTSFVALACFAAAIPTGRSSAEEVLVPGTEIVRPDGATIVLREERLLLDQEDTARLVLLVRELRRCQEARDACESRAVAAPPAPRTPWHVYGSVALAVFAAGFVAGTQVTK